MPAKRNRMALKAALLAPVGPIEAWGVQQVLAGETLTGGIAMTIGVLFVGAFVVIQEYDLPYEQEIVDTIVANQDEIDADDVEDVSEDVANATKQMLKEDEDLSTLLEKQREQQSDDTESG